MAYNKITNRTENKQIKYLSKDYTSYKNQLIEFAQAYFPENFNDFSEGNPGMMFLEMAAYVGDVLSFYTDTQIQETFLALSQDRENLYNIAYAMGYKPKATSAANVNLEVSHIVPSRTVNNVFVEDWNYALNLRANSTFVSTEGPGFYLTQDANFGYSSSFSPTTSSIHQYDSEGNPEYFLLTKRVPAISGTTRTKTFTIGTAERFKTLTLFDTNIISVESIEDSDGNIYHEVPYLAQDTIFEEVTNTSDNDPDLNQYSNETPYLLKLKHVPRRFVSRIKPNNTLEIQFGAGVSDKPDEQIIPNPDNIGLGIKDGRSKLDTAYDPSNFLYTKAYGHAPADTV